MMSAALSALQALLVSLLHARHPYGHPSAIGARCETPPDGLVAAGVACLTVQLMPPLGMVPDITSAVLSVGRHRSPTALQVLLGGTPADADGAHDVGTV